MRGHVREKIVREVPRRQLRVRRSQRIAVAGGGETLDVARTPRAYEREQALDAADHDEAVPERPLRDDPLRDRRRGLLAERADHERVVGDARAGENVAVARIRPFRLGAEDDDLLGMPCDELGGPSHPVAKTGVVRDVMIAGEHRDGGVGTAPREREEGQQDARAGVAVARLDDDVARRQRRELRPRER